MADDPRRARRGCLERHGRTLPLRWNGAARRGRMNGLLPDHGDQLQPVRGWRNGIRGSLRSCCPHGRGGSSPPPRTRLQRGSFSRFAGSGFRHAAQTPRERLKFKSPSPHQTSPCGPHRTPDRCRRPQNHLKAIVFTAMVSPFRSPFTFTRRWSFLLLALSRARAFSLPFLSNFRNFPSLVMIP